jgi:hypothetical protein
MQLMYLRANARQASSMFNLSSFLQMLVLLPLARFALQVASARTSDWTATAYPLLQVTGDRRHQICSFINVFRLVAGVVLLILSATMVTKVCFAAIARSGTCV